MAGIAELSQKIQIAHANGDPAASLRDQRDGLVREVGDRVGAKSIEDDAVHFTLFGGGVTLADGDIASSLSVGLDASGVLKISAARSGGKGVDVTSHVERSR